MDLFNAKWLLIETKGEDNMRKITLIILLCYCILFVPCKANSPIIKWSIETKGVYDLFWTNEKNIGIRVSGEFLLVDSNGKTLWKKDLDKGSLLSNKLRLLLYNYNRLVALSNEGQVIWEKQLNDKLINAREGYDGTIAVVTGSFESGKLKVFSNSGEIIWEKVVSKFAPIAVLPKGKAVIGMCWTKDSSNYTVIKIQIEKPTEESEIITTIKNAAFIESPNPEVSFNSITKQTLIVSESTPWWSIISDSGKILLNENKMPMFRPDLVTVCDKNFVIASSIGNKVSMVSDQGSVVWNKEFENDISSISGNESFLAISIGSIGSKGKVFVFTKDGKLMGSVDLPISSNNIKIAEQIPLVAVTQGRSKVMLIDFSK